MTTSIPNWERRTIFGSLAVVALCAGIVVAHAEYRGSGSYGLGAGRASAGSSYGHTYDSCGTECGNQTVFVGSGPIANTHQGAMIGYASQASRNGF
jgi:hypothetical protein